MSDEKWTMPEWLLEIAPYLRAKPIDRDTFTVTDTELIMLGKLRTAGLLLTEGQKRERDKLQGELDAFTELADGYLKELARLRAENERLKDGLRNISRISNSGATRAYAGDILIFNTDFGADDDT